MAYSSADLMRGTPHEMRRLSGERSDSIDRASAASATSSTMLRKQDLEAAKRSRSMTEDEEYGEYEQLSTSPTSKRGNYDGSRSNRALNHTAEGFLFLAIVLSCVVCFVLGVCTPLLEFVAFPGSGMELKFVDSISGMIQLTFQEEYYKSFAVLILTTFGIPSLLFIGSLILIRDGSFALAYPDSDKFLSPGSARFLASTMCVSTSYQVILPFLCLLFLSFFTGSGFVVMLGSGFYFVCLYCFISIALLQAMEASRQSSEEEDDQDEEDILFGGANLRRRFSSFFPSLPGVKRIEHVDAIQMFFFAVVFLIVLVLGFEEPLLDIRLEYSGIALQRMALSLRDIVVTIASSTPLPVVVVFTSVVIVAPLVYVLILTVSGIQEVWFVSHDGETKSRHCDCVFTGFLQFLRPWVMIDVFCIALVLLFLVGTQTEYMVSGIPDGAVRTLPGVVPSLKFSAPSSREATESDSETFWTQSLSGSYLVLAAGVAVYFMRWFWSTRTPGDKLLGLHSSSSEVSEDSEDEQDLWSSCGRPNEENRFAKYVCGKSCRGVLLWGLICLVLHLVLVSQPPVHLESVNDAMEKAVPSLNHLLASNLPRSMGNCAYPPDSDKVPQPCYDIGLMDQEMVEATRSTIEWVSGVNTIKLTNISITRSAAGAAKGKTEYSLEIKGFVGEPGGFLRLELCPKNHTTLGPILGEGLCKDFLETTDACCEKDRHFRIQLTADCQYGQDDLSNVQVASAYMDNITIAPVKKIEGTTVLGGVTLPGATILVADRDVTGIMLHRLQDDVSWAITDYNILNFGGKELTTLKLLNRILHFNAPHLNFHCR